MTLLSRVFGSFADTFLVALFLMFCLQSNWADAQSVMQSEKTDSSRKKIDFIFGLGGGVSRFMGDVQDQDNKVNVHLIGNRAVFDFHFGAMLSKSFTLSANMLYGKLSGNENTFKQNRNFETNMLLSGVVAEYNFAGLYKKRLPVLNPFINAGVYYGSYWKISTDLLYGDTQPYYYWSDGRIRNIAEDAPNSDDASLLSRDFEYESDLVKGALHTFNVSAGFGLDLHLSRAVTARLMTRYFFAVNDQVDGYSAGNASGLNDGFFYNSLSLMFNAMAFSPKRKDELPNFKYLIDFNQLQLIEEEDRDGDGIADILDRCAETPSGVEVDAEGCPVDKDSDGVPDYRDNEKNSAPDAIVDRYGVSVNYTVIAERYKDSLGVQRIQWHVGYLTGETEDDKKYTVNVKTVKKGSERMLSPAVSGITELRRKVINDSLVLFTLGVYDHFDEADAKSKRLNVLGEAQAYGVSESESDQVASDLYFLDVNGDPSLMGRSYGVKKNLFEIKKSKAYELPVLAYTVGRFEKNIDNNVPEYLLVKDFLNSVSSFTWDTIVKRSYDEVNANLQRMPVTEKPELYSPNPVISSSIQPVTTPDTLKVQSSASSTTSKPKKTQFATASNRETMITMAPVKPEFLEGDLDNNGFITSSEIERTLEEIMEGHSKLTVTQFNEMVQYYTYFTNNADPIDFGGTEVVIVDGVLTILKKEGEGFGDESRRILARKYSEVDFNQDGDLTADEVQKMINMFMDGKSTYSPERIYELIDLFFE